MQGWCVRQGQAVSTADGFRVLSTTPESVLKVAREDDWVLVAFSGHGVHLDGKSYFCPTDASLESPTTTMVPLDFICRQLEGSKARQKLLLVDACRNDPRGDSGRVRACDG
jgi:uncharacterized caspase-like protein